MVDRGRRHLAPILAVLTRGRIPDVVWLLLCGVLIGPHALGLAEQNQPVEFLRELGMGFLFLLAGFEVRPSDMRGRQGRHAAITWCIGLVLAFAAGWAITRGDLDIAIVLAIASTSTALGTLLPILQDSGRADTPLGRATMIHGACGELLPIIAMALLLSTRTTGASALILLAFAAVAALTVAVPARLFERVPMLTRSLIGAADSTMQTTMRFAVFVLISLMLLTAVLELDVALGAFAAGLLLHTAYRSVAPEQAEVVAQKVTVVGFSFLIPVFFVTSGMAIDIGSVVARWPMLLGFVATIAVMRGLVVFLRERYTRTHSGLTRTGDQAALGLYAATGLPIIVAVTQVVVESGMIDGATASVLVTGGAVTVLLFPLLAGAVAGKGTERTAG